MNPEDIPSFVLLSLIIFLPAFGALVICFMPKERGDLVKAFSLYVTVAVFLVTAAMAIPGFGGEESPLCFEQGKAEMQHHFSVPWIESFNIYYALGIDGISFPLIMLTSFISMLAMWASWPITKHVKGYCILFLLLETGMIGVFMALDFFLFYVFWEVMLLPMYFLIGVWGGPRREYAAIKFFLFTLLGSVLMLVALLMLYFNSDLHTLTRGQLEACKVDQDPSVMAEYDQARDLPDESRKPLHTFNLMALAEMGRLSNSPFDAEFLAGKSIQWWAFLLLLIGFLIKVPSVPVHTWLPDAHVEAPTPISMILAGVLLKMGGYGIIRICLPICPHAAYDLAWFVCALGVVSMVYGAFAALAQKDFKRLVAYSSVSHMGYVVLGLGAWTIAAGNLYETDYWKLGMNGAMFQMIAHGLSSAGMFFLVGVVYDRVHHRDLDKFGGLFVKMPLYSGLAFGIFFAAMGLPGLCGFIGEVFVVLSVWSYSTTLAVVAASVVILTAGYILWTLQRVYLGPEYKGPHGDALKPITARECTIAASLLAFAIVLGVYPKALFNYMEPSVSKTVDDLRAWLTTKSAGQPDWPMESAGVEAEDGAVAEGHGTPRPAARDGQTARYAASTLEPISIPADVSTVALRNVRSSVHREEDQNP
ncbi:MAG: complex I subunit 4 family protein [Planctomycetota bacterium]|jgi:NADH-quinone oxidoreductase subunit M